MDFDDDIDVEMTKHELLTKLYPLNGTVFEGRFLVDVNPSGMVWHKSSPINAIDAEFVDMIGGYKIDITAFGRRPSIAGFKPISDTELAASDGHSINIDDVFPLRQSVLDGHAILVPTNPRQLLQSEYSQNAIDSKIYSSFKFDGGEWKSASMPSRSSRSSTQSYLTNSQPFWIPFQLRREFATNPIPKNALNFNTRIQPQLEAVDIDNTIATNNVMPPSLHVIEYNIQRGVHWKRACDLIRKHGNPDIIFINEADWGMSRSNNEHVARRMAYELGLNYVWGVEFLELTPGTESETKEAKDASDCIGNRRGSGFSGKVDSLGLHGNAILSKYPLSNVRVVRSPGIEHIYGVRNDLTADGFELRLGGRMTIYATIHGASHEQDIHLGCFHHQMKWDSRFKTQYN